MIGTTYDAFPRMRHVNSCDHVTQTASPKGLYIHTDLLIALTVLQASQPNVIYFEFYAKIFTNEKLEKTENRHVSQDSFQPGFSKIQVRNLTLFMQHKWNV
jgi:hypothetical protein